MNEDENIISPQLMRVMDWIVPPTFRKKTIQRKIKFDYKLGCNKWLQILLK